MNQQTEQISVKETAPQPSSPFIQTQKKAKVNPFFIYFGIGTVIVMLLATIIRLLTPPTAPTSEFNTWQENITPGYSSISEVTQNLGDPVSQINTEVGIEYGFESAYPTIPHEVVTDETGTVLFVKEFVAPDEQGNISTYQNELGTADLLLKDLESGFQLDAYVYLDEGLVVLAHIADGTVKQKWYFVPTTAENFAALWGINMSADGPGPELAPLIDDSIN